MTIESSLESGCGLSRKSTQQGCNGTCVKLEASTHVKHKYGTFRGSIGSRVHDIPPRNTKDSSRRYCCSGGVFASEY